MMKNKITEQDNRLRGEIALALTKRLFIDVPTARAAVDEAFRSIGQAPALAGKTAPPKKEKTQRSNKKAREGK